MDVNNSVAEKVLRDTIYITSSQNCIGLVSVAPDL